MKGIKRLAAGLLISIFILTGDVAASGAEGENAVSGARYGVVRVLSIGPDGSGGFGTGFGVGRPGEDADTFITNWHVVTSSGSYDYRNAKVYILLDDETCEQTQWVKVREDETLDVNKEYVKDDNGNWYRKESGITVIGAMVECEVLYAENQYPDVAVIRTKEPLLNVETLPLRKTDPGKIGEKVYAIGYPATADIGSAETNNGVTTKKIKASVDAVTVTGGVISRCLPLELTGNTNCIVHDAHINHGNSGGPLILEDGSVIGINTYGYGDGGAEYNVSIYIDYAMEVMDQLGIIYTEADIKTPFSLVVPITVVGIVILVIVFLVGMRKNKTDQGSSRSETVSASESVKKPETVTAPMPEPIPGPLGCEELRLQGISGAFQGRRFPLEQEIRIGRDPKYCNFTYPPDTKGISGIHCIIRKENGAATVTDAGSTYGTMVNGKKLVTNQPYTLSVGDMLSLGSDYEKFQITNKGGVL